MLKPPSLFFAVVLLYGASHHQLTHQPLEKKVVSLEGRVGVTVRRNLRQSYGLLPFPVQAVPETPARCMYVAAIPVELP